MSRSAFGSAARLLLLVPCGPFWRGKLLKSPARRRAEWRRDLMLDDFVFGVDLSIGRPLNGETPTIDLVVGYHKANTSQFTSPKWPHE